MGQRGEGLANRFEQANNEFTKAVESCSSADWAAQCKGEGWPFGVTAHHVAQSHGPIAGMVQTISTGGAMPPLTAELLDGMNAAHAREHANCTKDETVSLLREQGAAAAKIVRGLSDDQLDKSGVFVGNEMQAEQIVEHVLIGHVTGHLESLKASVGA